MKNTDFAFCLNKFFVRYLPGVKGSSPSTIDSYRYSFINFLEYLQETSKIKVNKIKISDLSYGNVCGYLDWLEARKHNGPNTRNQRQAAINSFVRFLILGNLNI